MIHMKNAIGASLPDELYEEFLRRAETTPKGKSGLIKKALKFYFDAHPEGSESKPKK